LTATRNAPRAEPPHLAALRKRAVEADAKLKHLYDAIENGVADVADPMLKDRITELKATRDQAGADAERAEGALDRLGPVITPAARRSFARTGPRAHADRVGRLPPRSPTRARSARRSRREEVRIMGSKSVLLRTLVVVSSAKTVGFGVPGSVPKWRPNLPNRSSVRPQ